jgi:hypothetical protein
MSDPGFQAPNPFESSSSPQNAPQHPSSQSPFTGGSWGRTALLIVVAVVTVGAGLNTIMGEKHEASSTEVYYSSAPESSADGYSSDDYTIEASDTAGFSTYHDHVFGYALDYPSDWTVDPAFDGTMFLSPYEDAADYLTENVIVATEDVSYVPGLTLEEYMEAALPYLVEDPSYTYQYEGYQPLGDYDGMYVVGSYDMGYGDTAGVLTLFTISSDMVYLFNYTFESPEKDMYVPIVDHMIESFDLVGSSAGMTAERDQDSVYIPEEDYGFISVLNLGSDRNQPALGEGVARLTQAL